MMHHDHMLVGPGLFSFIGMVIATPEEVRGEAAIDGMIFSLHDKPEDSWLEWQSKIQLNKVEH